jgi:DNA-binding transcriptional ArsR family regulator
MAAEARRDVFHAIADPTRRAIIQLIARQPLNVNTIAENFDMSRPAISQHVKILVECGLVVIRQHGRERYCEAKLKKLQEVARWVEKYQAFWNDKLDSLENYLDSTSKNKRTKL